MGVAGVAAVVRGAVRAGWIVKTASACRKWSTGRARGGETAGRSGRRRGGVRGGRGRNASCGYTGGYTWRWNSPATPRGSGGFIRLTAGRWHDSGRADNTSADQERTGVLQGLGLLGNPGPPAASRGLHAGSGLDVGRGCVHGNLLLHAPHVNSGGSGRQAPVGFGGLRHRAG